MEVFSPRVALHPVGPLGWPFLAQTSPSEPATAEDERRAERRAGAPARSHRPTSTTLARRRVELAGPAGSPYAAIDTTSAGHLQRVRQLGPLNLLQSESAKICVQLADGGEGGTGPEGVLLWYDSHRLSCALALNDRHHDVRRIARIVENRLRCSLHACAGGLLFASVEIAIKAREVAGGDFHSQAMPGQKHVARGPQVNG